MTIDDGHTRRRTLELLAATAAAAGVSGVATAQDDNGDGDDGAGNGTDDGTGDGDGGDDRLPIVLGARREYWYGVAPEEIEGEENPTLSLSADEEYEIVWVNLDGLPHALIVETEDGEEVASSDETETPGEAVSATIQVSEDAAEYYCEYHPDSMRGDVEVDGGFDLSRDDGDGGDNGGDDGDGDDGNGNGGDDGDGGDGDDGNGNGGDDGDGGDGDGNGNGDDGDGGDDGNEDGGDGGY